MKIFNVNSLFGRLWHKYWPWAVIGDLRKQLADCRVALADVQRVLSGWRKGT